jgi:hypothetical protein
MRDRIDEPRHAAVIADLQSKLLAWLREHDDPLVADGEPR